MRRLAVWLFPPVLFIACGSSTEPLTLSAQLHSSSGQVGAPIPYTLMNRTADTLFASGCCAKALVYVDRRIGFPWEGYASGACLDICPWEPERVLPHDSITGSIAVFDSGTFRLRVDVARTWRGESPSTITSAAFTVR